MEAQPEGFSICKGKEHHSRTSIHPKDRVPNRLFVGDDGIIFKLCVDCRRLSKEKSQMRRDKKRAREHADIISGKLSYQCHSCNSIRTIEICQTCSEKGKRTAIKRKHAYHTVIWERIIEMGNCCYACKKVFLKRNHNEHGFITTDSLNGITRDEIEFRNMEFDHLSKEEQISIFGEYRGKKVKGVAKHNAYRSIKKEARLCVLLCISCHRRASQRRIEENPKTWAVKIYQEKKDYVSREKMRLGECTLCKMPVDPTNLSYFEYDHIIRETKSAEISYIMGHGTMEALQQEMLLCRLLCRFCHRIHSSEQSIGNNNRIANRKLN